MTVTAVPDTGAPPTGPTSPRIGHAIVVGAAGFAWGTAGLTLAACGSVWLLLITYPSGGTALYDWGYLFVILGVSVLAAVSLLKPDPLKLSLWTVKDVPERALGHHS